jgi:hypothetical protein
VALARETTIRPELEPRYEGPREATPPRANHPAFWSGYMLVDSGTAAASAETPVDLARGGPVPRAAQDKPEGNPAGDAASAPDDEKPIDAAALGGAPGDAMADDDQNPENQPGPAADRPPEKSKAKKPRPPRKPRKQP